MANRADSDPDSMVTLNREDQAKHYLSQWSKKNTLFLPQNSFTLTKDGHEKHEYDFNFNTILIKPASMV